jgi:hypothetical protein
LHEMMHPTYNLFLAIYLAHLLTDFVFQTHRIVTEKRRGHWRGYLIHGLTHYLAILAIVGLAGPARLLSLRFHLIVFSLLVVHLLVDWTKLFLTKTGRVPDNTFVFSADQAAHLLTVVAAAFLVVHPPVQTILLRLNQIRLYQDKILLVLVIYVSVIFGGGYFIRGLIEPLWKEDALHTTKEHAEVLNAGLYIGWLERFLVLTALFLQSPMTVGLILAAKSIARYPELKSVRFAEYFLIGTLLSISVAICGAIVLLKAFHGTVAFGN